MHVLMSNCEFGVDGVMGYHERERLKLEGSKKYHESESTVNKADGIVMVIEGHYWRSVENYKGKHPSFDIYAKHWLYQKFPSFYNKDAFALLITRFGKLKGKPRLRDGGSYWTSKYYG